MKLRFRGFERLSNAGPLHGGWEAALAMIFACSVCFALAVFAVESWFLRLLLALPGLALLYGFYIEVRGLFTFNDNGPSAK